MTNEVAIDAKMRKRMCPTEWAKRNDLPAPEWAACYRFSSSTEARIGDKCGLYPQRDRCWDQWDREHGQT